VGVAKHIGEGGDTITLGGETGGCGRKKNEKKGQLGMTPNSTIGQKQIPERTFGQRGSKKNLNSKMLGNRTGSPGKRTKIQGILAHKKWKKH